MIKRRLTMRILLSGAFVLFLFGTIPAVTHPGFLLNEAEITQIKQMIKNDGPLKDRWLRIKMQADTSAIDTSLMLNWRTDRRRPGRELSSLAMAYGITKDPKYADRAFRILDAFVRDGSLNWKDKSIFGVGFDGILTQFAFGFLFAYDMIYHAPVMTDSSRTRIETWFKSLVGDSTAYLTWKGRYPIGPDGWEGWMWVGGYDRIYTVPETQNAVFFRGCVGYVLGDSAMIRWATDGNGYPLNSWHHGEIPRKDQNPYSFKHFIHDSFWPTGGGSQFFGREGTIGYYHAKIFGAEMMMEAAWHRGVNLWQYRDSESDNNFQSVSDWNGRYATTTAYYQNGGGGYFTNWAVFVLPYSHYRDDITKRVLDNYKPPRDTTGGRRRLWGGGGGELGDAIFLIGAIDRSSMNVEPENLGPLTKVHDVLYTGSHSSGASCFEITADKQIVKRDEPITLTVRALKKDGSLAESFLGDVKLWTTNRSPAYMDYTGGQPRIEGKWYYYHDYYLPPRCSVWENSMEPDVPLEFKFTAADKGAKTCTIRLKNGGTGTSYRIEALYREARDPILAPEGYLYVRGWSPRIFVGEAKIKPLVIPKGSFVQDDSWNGPVSLEAEHFLRKTEREGMVWSTLSSDSFCGKAAVESKQGKSFFQGKDVRSCSRLDYPVFFNRAGTFRVWILGKPGATQTGLIGVGLDSGEVKYVKNPKGEWESRYFLKFRPGSKLAWSNTNTDWAGPLQLQVGTKGLHTVNLWMVEPGMVIDKILITPDDDYVPKEMGPAESKREMAGKKR